MNIQTKIKTLGHMRARVAFSIVLSLAATAKHRGHCEAAQLCPVETDGKPKSEPTLTAQTKALEANGTKYFEAVTVCFIMLAGRRMTESETKRFMELTTDFERNL